ncbi:MAG: NADH dehydrogenase subunit [Halolamina sp.]|uniref:NADH dehydrogenase subunit n=1 Tax=Halolamina sp. TaxID=1940283 RepID=UPI002FC30411
MSIGLNRLPQVERSEIATTIRNAGVSGAGGAGFPTYAKWERLGEVDYLLVNQQESEPNYYMDRWLAREHADELASFFDALLESVLDVIVIGAKQKDRDRWLTDLEAATGGEVYTPDELPLDPDEESGVVFAYTEDRYEYGMESVILRLVADVVMGKDLPMDHGWIVQNTETLYNIYRAIEHGETVTHKHLHVGGDVPRHRFLSAPIGTPATALLKAAGLSPPETGEDQRLLDGGPGWCFEIEVPPEQFGLRKRTNCLLVADEAVAEKNIRGEERVDIREPYDWDADHETEPTATLSPTYVRIPLITNPAFEGVVERSRPIVEPGDRVDQGEMIATPAGNDIGNTHHASVPGKVTHVTETHIQIQSEHPQRESTETDQLIYWTWCIECGTYVVMPDVSGDVTPKNYVCGDCR